MAGERRGKKGRKEERKGKVSSNRYPKTRALRSEEKWEKE